MKQFVIFACALVVTASSAYGQSSDEAAIREQLAGYVQARSADGATQAQFYALDADEWRDTNRQTMRGRAAIAADLDRSRAAQFRLNIESINLLSPELALVDTEFFSSAPSPTGHASYLMAKREGIWLIKSARIGRYPEMPPSGATAVATEVRAVNEALLAA